MEGMIRWAGSPKRRSPNAKGSPCFARLIASFSGIEAGRFSHNSNIRKFRIEVKHDALIRHAAENRRIM